MIKAILSDFSGVILTTKSKKYSGILNSLYKKLQSENKYFNFYNFYEFNEELLKFYTELKQSYSINIFTLGSIQNNSHEVQNRIKNLFDNIYSAGEMGLSKTDSTSYSAIAKMLKVLPEEIIFIDDSLNNIEAAKKAGLKTIYFQDNDQTVELAKNLLGI